MRLTHKFPPGYTPKKEPIGAAYEAQVAATLERAYQAWGKAQAEAEIAAAAAARNPCPATRRALDTARLELLHRLDELTTAREGEKR